MLMPLSIHLHGLHLDSQYDVDAVVWLESTVTAALAK